jgi:hypothetical protein
MKYWRKSKYYCQPRGSDAWLGPHAASARQLIAEEPKEPDPCKRWSCEHYFPSMHDAQWRHILFLLVMT